MAIRVGINGFGRIGRQVTFKAIYSEVRPHRTRLRLSRVNDLTVTLTRWRIS